MSEYELLSLMAASLGLMLVAALAAVCLVWHRQRCLVAALRREIEDKLNRMRTVYFGQSFEHALEAVDAPIGPVSEPLSAEEERLVQFVSNASDQAA